MLWWHWLILGIALLGYELVTPGGFYVLFFGAAALGLGALVALGIAGPASLQWLLFSVLSIASLLLFRGPLLRRIKLRETGGAPIDSMLGEIATPLDEIAPGAVGRVELRGAAWSARNSGAAAVASGQRCRVLRVEGLQLWIEAE
jgi:membrane protein implicated in regulation of membrane protease activity